jgi:hypothetical protein
MMLRESKMMLNNEKVASYLLSLTMTGLDEVEGIEDDAEQ